MQDQTYTEISVQKISPNNFNPRSKGSFKGENFDELKASIKSKGVISPILVRPVNDKRFEIVYGERRYSAVVSLAKENGNKDLTIPAVIKVMSDDELFDLMMIENVHREDLTPLEEAKSYQKYLEKRGDKALDDLAVRTGQDPRRIRRRLKVLDLPKKILKSWEKGELLFGHLEQFIRIGDLKIVNEFYDNMMDQMDEYEYPVRQLKDDVDGLAVALEHAKFNIAGCLTCNNNTDVQKNMFGIDAEKTHCLDMKCFREKQGAWFKENWTTTSFYKKFKTVGFVFKDDINHGDWQHLYGSAKQGIAEYCKKEKCEKYITTLKADGTAAEEFVCLSQDDKCATKVNNYVKPKDGEAEEKVTPTKRDHGQEFREHFYQLELPAKINKIGINDKKMYQLQFYSFMKVHNYLNGWFMVKIGLKEMIEDEDGTKQYPDAYWYNQKTTLWDEIKKLDTTALKEFIKEATIETLMNTHKFGTDERAIIADYLGTNLKKEWYITPEYLKKKRIKEILEFAGELKFFEKKTVKAYMDKTFGGDNPTRLKKKQLIRVFIESGQDLVGLVPKEILK